jgi:hypothetical protein
MVDVYDKSHVRRNLDWLQATFGNVRVLGGDQGGFKVQRIDCTDGPASLNVRVLGQDGQPQSNQPVALSWPSLGQPAEDLPSLAGGGLVRCWAGRAVFQRTNGEGWTGFGLGTQSWIRDLSEGGPYTVWVLSPSVDSDGLTGIGWLGGTNHEGPCSLTFQLAGGSAPEPPPTVDETGVLPALARIEQAILRLGTHLGAP